MRAAALSGQAELAVFLDELEASGRAPGTVRNYSVTVKKFLARVPSLREATPLDVRDYLDSFPSTNTRGVKLVYLRRFYRTLQKRGVVSADPTNGLKPPRKRRRGYPDTTEAEIQGVLGFLEAPVTLLVLVMYRLGSRLGETCRIRAEDVTLDGDEGVIDFPSRKGGDAGFAVFSDRDLADRLGAWVLDHRGYLFQDPYRPGEPIKDYMARKRIVRAGRRAGVRGKLTPHRLRHVFTTHAVNAGWPQPALQQQLGHRDPASTAIYYHPTRQGLLEVARRVAKRA